MNLIVSNNNAIVTDKNRRVTIINGAEYPWVKGMTGNNITQDNDKVYINGYELKNGEWKRTLKAMFHAIF